MFDLLCCKWKESYNCPNIRCNSYVYNVIAYQIVLYHCAQIISLNQMIWISMLTTSKNNQWAELYALFPWKISVENIAFLYKNWKQNKIPQGFSGIVVYFLWWLFSESFPLQGSSSYMVHWLFREEERYYQKVSQKY